MRLLWQSRHAHRPRVGLPWIAWPACPAHEVDPGAAVCRTELLSLAWSDVDLEGRSVRIRWSASVVDGSSDRGHHQGWPESNGEHRRLDGPGSAGSPGTTGLGSGW